MMARTAKANLVPVVLAGGQGTRLWPLSRSHYPKQFLSLLSEHSLLQQTLLRLGDLATDDPVIVCHQQHRFIAATQLQEIEQNATILLEPCGRNTAPALALAALHIQAELQTNLDLTEQSDPLLLVLSADHAIADETAFIETITEAIPLAEQGELVSFGITPTSAHTGYGYIRIGDPLAAGYRVSQFVEKPQQPQAQAYFESAHYLWNSGMFLCKASIYLAELQRLQPEIHACCQQAIVNAQPDLDFWRLDAESFAPCPAESIDCAVMEHTKQAAVVPLSAGWSDVGAWSALWQQHRHDPQGNAQQGDVRLQRCHNTLAYSNSRLVVGVGLTDLVVVETADAVMVAARQHEQELKHVVETLSGQQRSEVSAHRQVLRPWGSYDSLAQQERYQVKQIVVKPGGKLSVQMHHHRAEHWVVVSGTAKITNGERTFLLTENESTYIPIGTVHALENPGLVDLYLIEVQSGTYLGEDDIVRLHDHYGRAKR